VGGEGAIPGLVPLHAHTTSSVVSNTNVFMLTQDSHLAHLYATTETGALIFTAGVTLSRARRRCARHRRP
jgi:hypothetical protein